MFAKQRSKIVLNVECFDFDEQETGKEKLIEMQHKANIEKKNGIYVEFRQRREAPKGFLEGRKDKKNGIVCFGMVKSAQGRANGSWEREEEVEGKQII